MADRLTNIRANRQQRRRRVRSSIRGSAKRPRLSVAISHKHIRAQVIDDDRGRTLAEASTLKQPAPAKQPLGQRAAIVGEALAGECSKAKIKQVVFDRGWRTYHGRLRNLAEAARKEGLKF